MNLGQALDRLYDILGDVREDPQIFTRARSLTLINEGCLVFRRFVEDSWTTYNVDLVADTAVYDFQDQIRCIRIAYSDETLRPVSALELRSWDDKWETRDNSRPWAWTSDTLNFDQFRLYPKPNASTAETYVFVADPNVSGWNAEHGIIAAWDGATFSGESGILASVDDTATFSSESGALGSVADSGADRLTLWAVDLPGTLSDDDDELPIKEAFSMAAVLYAAWHTYEEESEHHNEVLAAFYRDEFRLLVEAAREISGNQMIYEVHRMGDGGPFTGERIGFPFATSAVIDGQPVNLGWPKHGW